MSALVSRSINSLSWVRLYPVLASTVVRLPTYHQPSRDGYRFDWRYSGNSYLFIRSLHISTVYNVQIQGSKPEKVKSEEQGQSQAQDQSNSNSTAPAAKASLFQRFKQMYKDYWYVLIPVHVVTSVFWTGGFYFAVKRYTLIQFAIL